MGNERLEGRTANKLALLVSSILVSLSAALPEIAANTKEDGAAIVGRLGRLADKLLRVCQHEDIVDNALKALGASDLQGAVLGVLG